MLRPFVLTLTNDQWDGLLEGDCPWLPPCCGNIGTSRGILMDARRDGTLPDWQVIRLLDNAVTHDVIREAWYGTPHPSPACSWAHRPGSPWPAIFQAIREWEPAAADRVDRLTSHLRTATS